MSFPRPPKAVTFDCWSTLIDNVDWEETKRARYEGLQRVAAARGVDLTFEEAVECLDGGWSTHVEAWRRGEIFGGIGAARWCLEKLGIEPNGEAVEELAEALGSSPLGTRPLDGAKEALEAVRLAGIPTALICDTGFSSAGTVRRYLAEHDLVLDHYFFSEEVGAPKPSPVIFKAALQTLGVAPETTVHIGDLRRTDIAGARGVGMATIRFTGGHDDGWDSVETQGDEADAVLRRWSDFPTLIGLDGA